MVKDGVPLSSSHKLVTNYKDVAYDWQKHLTCHSIFTKNPVSCKTIGKNSQSPMSGKGNNLPMSSAAIFDVNQHVRYLACELPTGLKLTLRKLNL